MNVEAVEANVWAEGGKGAEELAQTVIKVAEQCVSEYTPMYDWNWEVPEKIEKLGLSKLPVCIAKTQNSLSDNPKLLGRPKDFVVTVREIEIASGAGFLIPITGKIMRMPGLPSSPSAENRCG